MVQDIFLGDYMQNYQNNLISLNSLIILAKQSRAINDAWVQRALFALAAVYEPGLAEAVMMRLKLKAVVEQIDPFPFDTPSEEDFI
jgi:hypothetical protein